MRRSPTPCIKRQTEASFAYPTSHQSSRKDRWLRTLVMRRMSPMTLFHDIGRPREQRKWRWPRSHTPRFRRPSRRHQPSFTLAPKAVKQSPCTPRRLHTPCTWLPALALTLSQLGKQHVMARQYRVSLIGRVKYLHGRTASPGGDYAAVSRFWLLAFDTRSPRCIVLRGVSIETG